MGVYKKGYVCWSSKDIFMKGEGKTYEERYQPREGLSNYIIEMLFSIYALWRLNRTILISGSAISTY